MRKLTPFQVPTTDGKKIFEHFGPASANFGDFSLAHMIAPSGWTEPNQTPEFDEFVVVLRGERTLFLNDAPVVVGAGESIVAPKGVTVRYANTSDGDAEYMALCMPAFRPDRVHREEPGVGS
jgi:mannose-6-phosphate isomerase-like protein (cupin superfamily)